MRAGDWPLREIVIGAATATAVVAGWAGRTPANTRLRAAVSLSLPVGMAAGFVLARERATVGDLWPHRMSIGTLVLAAMTVVLVSAFARSGGEVALLLPVTFLGAWACLPDTEAPAAAFGAALPMAALTVAERLRHRAAPGTPVYGALAALTLMWCAVVGGEGRAGSVVGAWAGAGVLLVAPFARRLVGAWRVPMVVAPVVHVALVLWCARFAGLRESALDAFELVVPALAAAFVVLAAFGWLSSRASRAQP